MTTTLIPATTYPVRVPLVALLAAAAVSQVGSALTLVAVPWFVLQTTGSAAQAGLTGAAASLPYLLAGVFGGAWVDRVGFRRASILGDLTSGGAVALIPLLYATVGLALWQLLALVFLATLCDVPGATARRSLIPSLAALARTPLERANAFAEAIPRLATLLGPPTAGLLIALTGPTPVLYLDAATFAVSALVVALAVPARLFAAPDAASQAPRRLWADLREGFAFVWHDPLLRALTLTSLVTNFLDAPFSLLLAVFVRGTTGRAADLGLLVATFGAGALVASLLFAAIGTRLPRRLPFALWMGGFAVVNGILSLAPPLPVALAALFCMGLAAGLVNPLGATIRAERVPDALRGRVYGLTLAMSFAMIPLGRALGGVLAEVAGLHVVYLFIAVSYVVILGVTLVSPAYRLLGSEQRGKSNERKVTNNE